MKQRQKVPQDITTEIAEVLKSIQTNTYKGGNKFFLEGYLKIGSLLSEEFNTDVTSEKSKQKMKNIIERLSVESQKIEVGFSRRSLYYALKFYYAYHNKTLNYGLSWGHYRILASVSNANARRKLEKDAIENGWNRFVLERKARESGYYGGGRSLKWNRPSGEIFHYKIVNKDSNNKDNLWIDLGFNCFHSLDSKNFKSNAILRLKKEKKNWQIENADPKSFLYHYFCTLERVVDGDTLLVQISLGFDLISRQKIRLLGVNAPELGSADGEKAFELLKKKLKPGMNLLLRTHFQDKYGRYLGDILYSKNKKSDYKTLIESGIHLNEELSNLGYE
ncbi:DUF1016 family protein [Leptospira gomenensis]|uniref:DUF1016 family protein n=1 Tax=Leptospira gomenensis TaxID=2484974 RepID=A0A5F1YBL3_9LEPT|nr:DUF1016 N-terminal domain-containing protein [Leptospira gomenensis]TGK33779.1 DUF1016 family protein [Leptospira gomenensis]TGK38702.1 DUF1016 family protein [Leptospira gomenensis]TGK40589.1 DUF1016 family protein [Leptospira gomenensis]TGK65339.1 DUF1016 family protein [Leptospira gomenensis]